jgi:hypothetical protein
MTGLFKNQYILTIRGNIFATNKGSVAIQISSPQKNLTIENNIFLDQSQAIHVYGKDSPMKNPPLPTTIIIRNNLFANNRELIDPRLFNGQDGSVITIDHNAFSNPEHMMGTGGLQTNIRFADPGHFDFRVESDEGADLCKEGIGPCDDTAHAVLMQWKERFKSAPKALPLF